MRIAPDLFYLFDLPDIQIIEAKQKILSKSLNRI